MSQNESIADRGAHDSSQAEQGAEKGSPIKNKRVLVPVIIILLAVAVGIFWYVKILYICKEYTGFFFFDHGLQFVRRKSKLAKYNNLLCKINF